MMLIYRYILQSTRVIRSPFSKQGNLNSIQRSIVTVHPTLSNDLISRNNYTSCCSTSTSIYNNYRKKCHNHPLRVLPLRLIRPFSDDTATKTSSENDAREEEKEIDFSNYTKEIQVTLPELVEENGAGAKIVKWYKGEGEIIHPGDTICDIETDLFTFEYDIGDECIGVMKEILLKEGEKTDDSNAPICVILHEEDEVKDEKDEEVEKETVEKKD